MLGLPINDGAVKTLEARRNGASVFSVNGGVITNVILLIREGFDGDVSSTGKVVWINDHVQTSERSET